MTFFSLLSFVLSFLLLFYQLSSLIDLPLRFLRFLHLKECLRFIISFSTMKLPQSLLLLELISIVWDRFEFILLGDLSFVEVANIMKYHLLILTQNGKHNLTTLPLFLLWDSKCMERIIDFLLFVLDLLVVEGRFGVGSSRPLMLHPKTG